MTTPKKTTTSTRKAGTAKKTPTRRTDPYRDQQGQQIDEGGTAGVPIMMLEHVEPTFSGRTPKPEEYPFSKLEHSKKVEGKLVGPSFFIPNSAKPETVLARYRKRWNGYDGKEYRKFQSHANTMEIDGKMVQGMSVWRATKEEEAAGRADLEKRLAAKAKKQKEPA
jgi:hypothetical protein